MGFANEFRVHECPGQLAFSTVIAAGLAEGLAPVSFSFGCLTLTWLCDHHRGLSRASVKQAETKDQ